MLKTKLSKALSVSLVATFSMFMATSTHAAEKNSKPQVDVKSVATSERAAVNDTQFPKFPSLVPEGSNIAVGDVIFLSRQFNQWILRCDLWLSGDKRLCAVEQNIKSGDDNLTWRIMTGADGRTWGVVNLSSNFDRAEGIRMGFSGVEKTLRNSNEISCESKDRCTAVFPFEGFVQIAIMKSPSIWFSYYKEGKSLVANGSDVAEAREIVTLTSNMAGLMEALNAAATNPYAPVKTEVALKDDGKKSK